MPPAPLASLSDQKVCFPPWVVMSTPEASAMSPLALAKIWALARVLERLALTLIVPA